MIKLPLTPFSIALESMRSVITTQRCISLICIDLSIPDPLGPIVGGREWESVPVISSWAVGLEQVWRKSTTHSLRFWSDSVNSSSTSWRAERVMYSRLRLAILYDLDASLRRLNELVEADPSAGPLLGVWSGTAPVEPPAVEPPIP